MEVAPVTLDTFDPLVVQLEAVIVIFAVSGLVPLFCSGGSNVTVPVPEQVMLPVATVGALVDKLVDVGRLVVLVVDVGRLVVLVVDVGRLVVLVELLELVVDLLGLEEHAVNPTDSAKPTTISLGKR